jgi:hypothetical protein
MAGKRVSPTERLAIRQTWLDFPELGYEFVAHMCGRPVSTVHEIIRGVASRRDVERRLYELWKREAEDDGAGYDRARFKAWALRSAWTEALCAEEKRLTQQAALAKKEKRRARQAALAKPKGKRDDAA